MSERPGRIPPNRVGRAAPHPAEERRQLHREQARRRNGRRHRQRRKGARLVFRILLLVLLLGAVACGALTLLCKAETIEVVGSARYDPTLVLQCSGVQQGDSLLMMNGASISEKVSSALPYVQKIVLHRTLPSKVVLEVVEAVPARAYVMEGGIALCDAQGRLLETQNVLPDGVPLVLGAKLTAGTPGAQAQWESEQQQERMAEIDRLLTKCELDGITRYDLRDEVGLKLYYRDAIALDFGSQSNFEYKIRFAKEYLESYYIEGQSGILDLSMVSGANRKVYFRERDLSEQLADTGFVLTDNPSEPEPSEGLSSEEASPDPQSGV